MKIRYSIFYCSQTGINIGALDVSDVAEEGAEDKDCVITYYELGTMKCVKMVIPVKYTDIIEGTLADAIDRYNKSRHLHWPEAPGVDEVAIQMSLCVLGT